MESKNQEKILKKKDAKEFDNISITAFRIISILNMLLKEPLSDDDINLKLQGDIEGFRNLSKDTICIYINTLRAIGCEISRPGKNNGYKYVLKSHPFKLNMSLNEINTIIGIRKYIATLGNWKLAIEIDSLLNQVADIMTPEDKKSFLAVRKSVLCREINIENILPKLNLLEKYCEQNKDIKIVYNSPRTAEKEICLNAEKLTLENDSFYLWGYNYNLNETSYLRLDRIIHIELIETNTKNTKNNILKVKYKLTGNSAFSYTASESEKIIEKSETDLIIQAKVTNKFKFIQDVLSYGADCTVLSPESIRREIILKLKSILESAE